MGTGKGAVLVSVGTTEVSSANGGIFDCLALFCLRRIFTNRVKDYSIEVSYDDINALSLRCS